MDKFIFGTYDTSTNGIVVFKKRTRYSAWRLYDRYTIPGKNGTFLYDYEIYENVPLEYDFVVYNNVRDSVRALRNNLLSIGGYQKLTDTFDTDEYYEAYYNGKITVNYSPGDTVARGTLTFERKPQRFLTSGDTATTITAASATLSNDTMTKARPIIRVVGAGTFSINGNLVTIASHENAYIDIDSEKQDCYCGSTNCNGFVTFANGEFPVLIPGTNTIAKTDITSLAITPKWWRL